MLRLSSAMLNSLIDKQIDVQAKVRDVVLGTPVSGVARVTGQPRVELDPSVDQARFAVAVSGTVNSRTVGRNGPVTIHGRSVTRFTATRPIVFEPGQGFYALPQEITAHTQVFTDRITTSRRGLIGRIIQRRAREQVAAQQAQLTAIARQRATTRISAAFERHMEERLARLNRAVEFRSLVTNLRNQKTGTPQVLCCTTEHYVEIADTFNNDRSTITLPVWSAASEASAPIEIWFHNAVVPEGVATALKSVLASPDQNAILNGLALLPGQLGKDAAAGLMALVSDNKIGIQSVGEWTVVEVNSRPAAELSVARRVSR